MPQILYIAKDITMWVKEEMNKKIFAIFIAVCFLILAGNTSAIKLSKPTKNYKNYTMEELIKNFDPNCKDMTDEEVAEYIEKVKIKPNLATPEHVEIQKPAYTVSTGDYTTEIFEPPWGVHDITYKEEKWGISEAGCEGTADAYQGWTHVAAVAGPGAGEASMTVWITHGIYYCAPYTDEYNIHFEYDIEGWYDGSVTGIDACISVESVVFFIISGVMTEREEICYDQSIPIIHMVLKDRFGKHFYQMYAEKKLIEGNYYYIEVQAAIKVRALGALMDWGYMYGYLADFEADELKDGSVLSKIVIKYPEHNKPPNKASDPYPENGAIDADADGYLMWKCSDPNDPEESLKCDVYFGTTNPPPLVEKDVTKDIVWQYDVGDVDYKTTYYWRIDVKDPHGEKTQGDVWHFTTKEKGAIPRDFFLPGFIRWLLNA